MVKILFTIYLKILYAIYSTAQCSVYYSMIHCMIQTRQYHRTSNLEVLNITVVGRTLINELPLSKKFIELGQVMKLVNSLANIK